MGKINLREFQGDTYEKMRSAMEYMKDHPGSVLTVDPGTYHVTAPRAREIQSAVMSGALGKNPQPVMFSKDFEYDRFMDFDGQKNTSVEAYGAVFVTDGFMEEVSFRNCSGCTVSGAAFDCKRRPYSRGTVTCQRDRRITVSFGADYPICEGMPYMRCSVWETDQSRFHSGFYLEDMTLSDDHTAEFTVCGKGNHADFVNKIIYIWHTFHFRPAILMENSSEITVKDVSVYSHPGMGITAQHSKNIMLKRFRVVPAKGELMSANTDATHFASCRGKLTLEDCTFIGQGDDSINVHTYYYNIVRSENCTARLALCPPDGTHAQSWDQPEAGDSMVLVHSESLDACMRFRVVSVERTEEYNVCNVTFDKPLPEDTDGYLFADEDAVPQLRMTGCVMKHHFARGALIKCKKALIENCHFEDIGDAAIKIAAEASWLEGISTEDVTVKNNRMIGCGHTEGICGGIFMYMETNDRSRLSHKKLCAVNNHICCPDAKYAMYLANVEAVQLENNDLSAREEKLFVGDGVKIG